MYIFFAILIFCSVFAGGPVLAAPRAAAAAEKPAVGYTVTKHDIDIYQDCAKEMEFTEQELEAALNNHDKNADEKVKCFNGCLFRNYNLIKDDGSIDADEAVTYYYAEKNEAHKKIVKECSKKIEEDNVCDAAHAMDSCVMSLISH